MSVIRRIGSSHDKIPHFLSIISKMTEQKCVCHFLFDRNDMCFFFACAFTFHYYVRAQYTGRHLFTWWFSDGVITLLSSIIFFFYVYAFLWCAALITILISDAPLQCLAWERPLGRISLQHMLEIHAAMRTNQQTKNCFYQAGCIRQFCSKTKRYGYTGIDIISIIYFLRRKKQWLSR